MKRHILAIDIGGSGLKATVIDERGNMLAERVRVPTPHPCPPGKMVDLLVKMAASLPAFDCIAIGFPGVVRHGKILTAVNIGGADWNGFALAEAVSRRLDGKPARMVNDADMQGLALVSGKGIEFVFTFGTGVGTSLFRDGELMPHMELAHHPMRGNETYEDYLGEAALEKVGKKRWNRRVRKALKLVEILLRPDRIYLGGGNSRHVEQDLSDSVIIGSNEAGLMGGAELWRSRKAPH